MAIKDIRENLKRLKDSDPVEIAAQVNNWLQESGDAIRLRVEDEVEKAVTKRGFVKRSEFIKLEARIQALEGKSKMKVGKNPTKSTKVRESAKKTATKSKTSRKGEK